MIRKPPKESLSDDSSVYPPEIKDKVTVNFDLLKIKGV